MRSGTGRGTHPKVWNGSGDPLEGLGRVGVPFPDFRYGSGDPRGGSGRVGVHSPRSGTGPLTYVEVPERLGDSPGGLGRVGVPFPEFR